MGYKAERPPHFLQTVSSSLLRPRITVNAMMFFKSFLALSLAALALAAPSIQPRKGDGGPGPLGGMFCSGPRPFVET